MKDIFLTLLFLLFSPPSFSVTPVTPSRVTPEEFIPAGYFINAKKEADLNGDKLVDVVMVLSPDWEKPNVFRRPEGEKRNRILMILFKTADGKYTEITQTDKFIMNLDEGGQMGDPFYEGLDIKNNVLIFNFSGGGWGRWSYSVKFRWQNNDFYLIGFTSWVLEYLSTGVTRSADVNWITGDVIITTGLESDESATKTTKLKRKLKPITLKNFSFVDAEKMIGP